MRPNFERGWGWPLWVLFFAESSAFAKRGACKRGLRKLHIGHHQLHLVDVSDIFYFFLFWGGGKGGGVRGGGWGPVLIGNRGKGGGSEERRGRGRVPWECLRGGGGGGGSKYFFRGRNAHQVCARPGGSQVTTICDKKGRQLRAVGPPLMHPAPSSTRNVLRKSAPADLQERKKHINIKKRTHHPPFRTPP